MNEQIFELREQLQQRLPPMRYEHTLSVSYICIALAMRYGFDLDKAELAGLLHDCAKRYDNAAIIEKCRSHGVALTDEELLAPAVLHAKYGAWMAAHKYRINDQEILSAIRWHTTGRPDMTLLDKILYVADYIEPRRYKADGLEEIRRLAFLDLDETMYRILKSTLDYLGGKGVFIDSMTKKAYDFYSCHR